MLLFDGISFNLTGINVFSNSLCHSSASHCIHKSGSIFIALLKFRGWPSEV